ncbi:MAG: glycoside hydrolase family 2 TIM barrel-domain containing protein [Victivallaceae bacterium]|nr:glycoside hydrolase family 2 TIM barrel-domain containing protein [Victivallaceae bacterium]
MSFNISEKLWQSPGTLNSGVLPVRSPLNSFAGGAEALAAGKKNGPYRMPLDGPWKFGFHPCPAAVAPECDAPDFDDSAWPEIDVPGCWDMHGYDHPIYTNIRMPWPEMPPSVPEADNPAGVYRRRFELPEAWRNRRTVLHFDGVESFFAVAVNGRFAGFAKDSRAATEFDITALLVPGVNVLAVMVVKWSDGCFIEDQDQWWHGGIVRKVYLRSMPSAHIFDLHATAGLCADMTDGDLTVAVVAGFMGGEPEKWRISASLYSAAGRRVWRGDIFPDRTGGDGDITRRIATASHVRIPRISPWSAESPVLYTLVCELVSDDGAVCDAVPVRVGFRTVAVAGRRLLVNGRPVRICGVNRHEHDMRNGRSVPTELTELDLKMMKRFNINAIRTSHYPPAPEFFDLADEYGFYVTAEANLECHAFYHDLACNPSWAPAFVGRAANLVMRDKNHPCVLFWSLGNESGCGPNHAAMAGWIRRYDPSRLLHYEGACQSWAPGANRDLTDVICPMYPPPAALANWAEMATDDPRPLIMCEFSHAMGNSNGGLSDYFSLFDHYDALAGGYIWEWLDHGIETVDAAGRRGYLYGGDFGETVHDSNFVADGLVWPDRTPHPGLFELKKLAQPLKVEPCDLARGRIAVVNRRSFSSLTDLECRWTLEVDGRTVQRGRLTRLEVPPRAPAVPGCPAPSSATAERPRREFVLPLKRPELREGEECFLTLRFVLRRAARWADAGFEVACEQFAMPWRGTAERKKLPRQSVPSVSADGMTARMGELTLDFSAGAPFIGFGGRPLVLSAPVLDILRGPTDNDGIKAFTVGNRERWKALYRWEERRIFSFVEEVRTLESGCAPDGGFRRVEEASSHAPSGGPSVLRRTEYRLDRRGVLHLISDFTVPPELDDLPRLGLRFELPADLNRVRYFGRGPLENHRDRAAAALTGLYDVAAEDIHVPYIMPQQSGNRSDVRFVMAEDACGRGLAASAPDGMEFTLSRYDAATLYRTMHDYELEPADRLYLSLDFFQRGVGSGSCGPDTGTAHRLPGGKFRFILNLYFYRRGRNWMTSLIREVR